MTDNIDISSLKVVDASSKPSTMTLLHPATGRPLSTKMHVLGGDCPSVVKAIRDYMRSTMGEEDDKSPDEILMKKNIVHAIAALVGWDDFMWNSEAREFDTEMASGILSDPNFYWIVQQVTRHSNERTNFMK